MSAPGARDQSWHVAVVGGGWAGLAAALQLGRARRRVVVVDTGRPRNRFAHASHGFLGQDGRSPAEIGETFRAQVLAYPTVALERGEAVSARRSSGAGFEVALATGAVLRAERLILATGVVDELPPVAGLEERWGVTVLHCPYCHGFEVADRRLGVLAAGPAALHQALLLRDWSDDVTLFTNAAIELEAPDRDALAGRGIRVEPVAVSSVVGQVPTLTGIELQDGRILEIDALFTAPRTRLANTLAEQLGCALEDGPMGPIVRTDAQLETTVPGVFCAGDAGRARHTATFAAADGVMAGISAHQSLVFAAV